MRAKSSKQRCPALCILKLRYQVLLYDSLKFSFVYQRAIFLILRLPQVNKNVFKFQICDYIVWSPSFQYDFGIIISVASKTTSTQKQRNNLSAKLVC